MTDEEKGPDPREKFNEAIKELLEAYNEDTGLLSDWVLITAESYVLEDGSTSTSLSTFINKHQAIHTTAGLLKYGTTRNEHNINAMRNQAEDD